MTSALALQQHPDNRSEQVERLRRQIAGISGKVGSAHRASNEPHAGSTPEDSLLPIPESLAGLLPRGLPRGAVAVLTGARSLSLSMVAAVTKAGGYAAIVGDPRAGVLAAAEMGADLGKLALIPEPGADPFEVTAVLMDGMDLVVLELGGNPPAPARARTMMARARHKGCTLLITGADWSGAAVRLDARIRGYELTADRRPGQGRIGGVRISMRALGKCARVG